MLFVLFIFHPLLGIFDIYVICEMGCLFWVKFACSVVCDMFALMNKRFCISCSIVLTFDSFCVYCFCWLSAWWVGFNYMCRRFCILSLLSSHLEPAGNSS